jgi:Flp pilus assembly protein TadG
MVELALVTPLIILLILAIIDFGRIYTDQLALSHAVRSGARAAIVLDTTTYNTTSLAKTQILTVINSDAYFFSVSSNSLSITSLPWGSGDSITIQASYNVKLNAPVIKQIYGTTFPIKSQVVMMKE